MGVPNKVIEFAKKNGYKNPSYRKQWNGYDCYHVQHAEFDYSKGILFIGYPPVILVKDGRVRMLTVDEQDEYMRHA